MGKRIRKIEELEKLEEDIETEEKKKKNIKLILSIVLLVIIFIAALIKGYIDLTTGKRKETDYDKKIDIWNEAAGNSEKRKLDDMNIDYTSSFRKSGKDILSKISSSEYTDIEKDIDTYTYFHEIKTGHEKETYEDTPYLIPYLAFNSDSAVIIVPGGLYAHKTIEENDKEGAEIAKVLQENGINAFVLHYRSNPYEYPIPMLDLQRAIRYVKYRADFYEIDKNKVGVIGFSSGGNLVASYINLVMGKNMFPEGYKKNEIDAENDTIAGAAFIYPMTTFNYNVPMLFALFDDNDVKNETKRKSILAQMDLKTHLANSKKIPQFISYGSADSVTKYGPKEYVDQAQKEKMNITVKIADNQVHEFEQNFYMSEYLEWINKIFDKNKGKK